MSEPIDRTLWVPEARLLEEKKLCQEFEALAVVLKDENILLIAALEELEYQSRPYMRVYGSSTKIRAAREAAISAVEAAKRKYTVNALPPAPEGVTSFRCGPPKDHECDSKGPMVYGGDGVPTVTDRRLAGRGYSWGSVTCSVCKMTAMDLAMWRGD